MGTYAGFQKYDTPNIGNDAANMLIQKQQMDAQKAQQEKQDAYKQMEYGIKLQKEQRDALSANEKDINEGITKVSEAANKIPAAGYASMPTALTAMVGKARQSFGNFARSGASITERNIMERQYIDVFNNFAQTGEIIKVANESMGKAKDPDTLAQFVLQTSSLPASPNPDNTVELDIEDNGGMLLPKVKSYQKNSNGELELTQSLPLEQINAIATIGNYEAPNYRKQAEEMFKSIGINEVDTIQKGGTKRTIVDPKAQDNFKKTKEDYINWVMMNNPGDAYMKLVKSPTDKANYLMEGATDAQRKNVAMSQGVENVDDAKIIYVSRNSKVGGFRAELTPEMESKLKDKLGEVFDNMSPYKVDVTTPHITNINNQMMNVKDDKIGRMYDNAADKAIKGDLSGLNYFITMGKVAGIITPEKTVSITRTDANGKAVLDKDENIISDEFKTFDFDPKTKVAKIWVDVSSNGEQEQIIIDFNNKEEARIKLAQITDAAKVANANKALQPTFTKEPVKSTRK